MLVDETDVVCVYIDCGMYHNGILTADGKVLTWGSNRYGCLGRPSEMAALPVNYTPVPGLVEGIDDFGLGPACSIACGRFYTVRPSHASG